MKSKNIAPEEYYHIYNRGMQKQPIFENDSDRLRFLFLILTFQGKELIKNISREVKQNVQSSTLHISKETTKNVAQNRQVELVSFCLMPNHFHLIVKEKEEGGIAKYMQRILTSYTKYFNKKYNKSGHLFQGSYKSILIEDDRQLMHLSAYIHKNPSEIKGWKNKEDKYYWSSYNDYIYENRWDELLSQNIILDRYNIDKEKGTYKKFVETSLAKETVQSSTLHS
ncbi:MAG: transposase [Candidatus Nomurabacteria bacterium]|nr:transposase [Candidatus Nomurabacteria bacterium]